MSKGKGIFNVSLWDKLDPSDDFYLIRSKILLPSPEFAQVLIACPIKLRVKLSRTALHPDTSNILFQCVSHWHDDQRGRHQRFDN